MAIEEQARTTIDETAFAGAATVADLAALAGEGDAAPGHGAETVHPPTPGMSATADGSAKEGPVVFPTWNRRWPFTWVRNVSLPTWILPIGRAFAWVTVEGLGHLEHLPGPVVFASNHQSHLDGPMILWSLPPRWRYRVAIAIAAIQPSIRCAR
jgi:hypothetical protein